MELSENKDVNTQHLMSSDFEEGGEEESDVGGSDEDEEVDNGIGSPEASDYEDDVNDSDKE